MPPTIRKDELRQAQGLFVNPQRTIRSVATGQQGGHSGTIPGTDSDPTQLGMQWSTIQPPDTGDQVAAVGHAVLANDGSPVVVMGNMAVSGDSGYPPEGFQDGGFVFTDAEGNAVAGYSHPTGLWGFSETSAVTAQVNLAVPDDESILGPGPLPITLPIQLDLPQLAFQSGTYPPVPLLAACDFLWNYVVADKDVTLWLSMSVFNADLSETLTIQQQSFSITAGTYPNIPLEADYVIQQQTGTDLSIVANSVGSGIRSAAGGNYACMAYLGVLSSP